MAPFAGNALPVLPPKGLIWEDSTPPGGALLMDLFPPNTLAFGSREELEGPCARELLAPGVLLLKGDTPRPLEDEEAAAKGGAVEAPVPAPALKGLSPVPGSAANGETWLGPPVPPLEAKDPVPAPPPLPPPEEDEVEAAHNGRSPEFPEPNISYLSSYTAFLSGLMFSALLNRAPRAKAEMDKF